MKLRFTHIVPCMLVAGCLSVLSSLSSTSAGVFECIDAAGARIFTDRPAQLQKCTPMAVSNSSSSSVLSPPTLEHQPAIDSPPPAFMAQPDIAPQPAQQPSAIAPSPCVQGFNPLNPIAGPPCHLNK